MNDQLIQEIDSSLREYFMPTNIPAAAKEIAEVVTLHFNAGQADEATPQSIDAEPPVKYSSLDEIPADILATRVVSSLILQKGNLNMYAAIIQRLIEELRAKAPVRESSDEPYLVWSNEHNAWWGPNHSGYYVLIENAGRYSKEEACKICRGANYAWDGDMSRPNELPIAESAAQLIGLQKEYRTKRTDVEGGHSAPIHKHK